MTMLSWLPWQCQLTSNLPHQTADSDTEQLPRWRRLRSPAEAPADLPVVGGQSLIDAFHMLELTSVSPADFQEDEHKKNRDY